MEGWYTIHCFYAADTGLNSGYVSNIARHDIYNFYCKAGADAVLKKLGSSIIDLGTGTSFDVKAKYSDYKQLNVNDFVIEPEALPDRILGGKGTHGVDNNNVYAWIRFTKTKSYNAETGILTAYVTPSGGYGSSTAGVTDTASSNRPVHAYLIVA